MTEDDDVDDDLLWEEFSKLSDAQQDTLLEVEMRKYSEWFGRLSRAQQIKLGIRSKLEGCVTIRRCMKMADLPMFREWLRDRQKGLLALRIERNTGQIAGQA